MLKNIADLVRQGKFRPPNFDKHKLDDWKTAVGNVAGGSYRKQLFIM